MQPNERDESTSDDRTPDSEAVAAAEQMNDPDGAHPGVVDDAPDPDGDDPLPEQMP